MRFLLPVILTCALWSAGTAHADTPCLPTPQLAAWNYPGAKRIPPGNNLLLPAGKAVMGKGQQLVIVGRLFDNRCIPIINATVEIWQVDPYGRWVLATGEDLVNTAPVFTGAGRTYTDNGGQFFFTTAFPAPIPGRPATKDRPAIPPRAPHINVKVKADGMPEFNTVLYFAYDARNGTDGLLKKISLEQRQRLMMDMGQMGDAGFSGVINIVMPSKAPFRSY